MDGKFDARTRPTEDKSAENDEENFDDSIVMAPSNATSSLVAAKGKSTLASTVSRNPKESLDDVYRHYCNDVPVRVRVRLIRRGHSYGA